MKNIVLTGFMGTGKTCVGKIIADKIGQPFVDLDEEVEQAIGVTIAEYFALHGESAFRDREQEAVERLAARGGCVIATGGGVVLRQQNIDCLRATGVLVCLAASEQEILARTAGDSQRPLLNRPDRLQAVHELLTARLPLYRQADVWVETGGRTPAETAEWIIGILREEGWLDGNGSGSSRNEKL